MEEVTALQIMEIINRSIGELRTSIEDKIDSFDEKIDHVVDRVNEIDKNISINVAEHEIRIKQIEIDHELRIKQLESSIKSTNDKLMIWSTIKKYIFNKWIIPILIALVLIIRGTFGTHLETYIDKYIGYQPKVMQIDSLKRVQKKSGS